MIYNMRIQKFMQKSQLKKRQRDMVQYFMRYVIEDDEIQNKEVARRQATADQLIDGMDPVSDMHDRRILFELTKRRVEAEDYYNDTSFEEDSFGDNQNGAGGQDEEVRNGLLVDEENNRSRANHNLQMSIPPPERQTNFIQQDYYRNSPFPDAIN